MSASHRLSFFSPPVPRPRRAAASFPHSAPIRAGRSRSPRRTACSSCSGRSRASRSTRGTATSGSCIARRRCCRDEWNAKENRPVHAPLLQVGRAVIEFDAGGNYVRGWAAERSGLRLAEDRARHPHRPRGERLARRQRKRGPPDPEVHARRQVPDADRAPRQIRGQQQPRAARPPGAHGALAATSSSSPTATATGAWWCSTPRPARTSATGARTARAQRRRASRRYDPAQPLSKSSATRCIACACRTTAWCTSATGRTTASRCSRAGEFPAARSASRCRRSPTARRGTWCCRTTRRRNTFTSPTARTAASTSCAAPTARRVGAFGRTGRMAGEFKWIHNIAIDRDGNLYTSEVGFGRRVQKFVRSGGAF